MAELPVLRPPTEDEQAAFDKKGRWPESYVMARLKWDDDLKATLATMAPLDAMRALFGGDAE